MTVLLLDGSPRVAPSLWSDVVEHEGWRVQHSTTLAELCVPGWRLVDSRVGVWALADSPGELGDALQRVLEHAAVMRSCNSYRGVASILKALLERRDNSDFSEKGNVPGREKEQCGRGGRAG